MPITKSVHFGIQRKIVANMTTESWRKIPHATYIHEADVTDLFDEFKKLNAAGNHKNKITFNTLMLKTFCECLKEAPVMNSHITFDRHLVRGRIDYYDEINISMPMLLPNGEMMTINLHNFENKTLDEMTDYIADVVHKFDKTNIAEAMYEVSFDDTMDVLKKCDVVKALRRLIGAKTGKYKVKTLHGKAKKEYEAIPKTDRLTKTDIEQGTVTVTNVGSVYREQMGAIAMLEIIPPQVVAIAIPAIQERPTVITNAKGEKEIAIRKILPLCIAFDHRAIDFAEIVPFCRRLTEITTNPSQIQKW